MRFLDETRSFTELSQFDLDAETIKKLPMKFCLQNHVAVLDDSGDTNQPATVGMLHPDNSELVNKVSEKLESPVKPVQLNSFEIRHALSTGYDVVLGELEDVPELKLSHDREIRFEEDLSPSQLLRDLLSEAVRVGASDVHIENYRNDVDLRFRVDGVLRQVTTPLSVENVDRVISKLKVMTEMDITDKRHAKDGRFTAAYRNEEDRTRMIDIRLNVIPGTHGEEAVMRILDREQFIFDTDHLGFTDLQEEMFQDLIDHPSGMILTVGPTASGKTTTLYTAIDELADAENKILSVEDPIEYQFDKVNQKQVSNDMSFADYTRAFLRQNPDAMMVGEIRDEETAEIAVRAANTGHLVLSTLHTGSAVMSISRLRSLGADDDYLAEVLLGMISQRLVRTICSECKTEVDPDPLTVKRFYPEEPDHTFYDGEGCEACDGTGYDGRTGIFELLVVDEELRQLIAEGTSTETIRQHVEDMGFEPLHVHALEKVEQGLVSLSEVARIISPPVELREIVKETV